MLHKLVKFHYKTVFTSQIIQWNVLHVSCLGILDDIMTFEYVKI